MKRANLILAIAALALLAAAYITAHPCDVDGTHDDTCMVRP